MTPTPRDLWTFARVHAGLPVDGELDVLSEPFRAIGGQLARLTPEERPTALIAFLHDRDDRDRMTLAPGRHRSRGPASGSVPG